MKKLVSDINYNTNPVGIYNQLKRAPGTSFQEAKRTLHAIKVLQKHPKLLSEVIRVTEQVKNIHP